ncbi:MAG: putative quinol monooxygenase [Pseudomonadota bacterium]
MSTLFVFATIHPKPEHFEDAKAAIQGIIEETRSEPGCLFFALYEGREDNRLYLHEEWTDASALESHYAQPYTRAVFDSYAEWLAEPVDVVKMRKVA